MPSSHLILGRPLLLLPPIPPSIRVFSNESTIHMRWPKYWSFSFSIIPSKEIPGQISFRMDWLNLLAVQGTLNSLLQHHSSKLAIHKVHAPWAEWSRAPYPGSVQGSQWFYRDHWVRCFSQEAVGASHTSEAASRISIKALLYLHLSQKMSSYSYPMSLRQS